MPISCDVGSGEFLERGVEPRFADVTPRSGEVGPHVELDERARCSHEEAWSSAEQPGHAPDWTGAHNLALAEFEIAVSG